MARIFHLLGDLLMIRIWDYARQILRKERIALYVHRDGNTWFVIVSRFRPSSEYQSRMKEKHTEKKAPRL